MYRIGIDIGGTFTDLVAVDESGRLTTAKAATTPEDQSLGVMTGLDTLAAKIGTSVEDLLGSTERVVHGTTVATNALIERKGASVALLTTEGHRDVLEMREGLKPERYDLRLPRPEPLVPRYLRFGIAERIRADRIVEEPLDPRALDRTIRAIRRDRIEAVAVCYLHAYLDDRHERMTREILSQALPKVYISLSSDVLPQIKEYERVSTTVVNAYVGPLIERYVTRFEARLREAAYGGPVLIILSHGGVAPVDEAIRLSVGTVLSGPAGGLAGAAQVGRISGLSDLVTFDMGGTSSDISLVVDGEAKLSADRTVAGARIALPSLDIATLGAGGGSIARAGAAGLLTVGPDSAGADPGPACYGRGGTEPTVTDASVALGLIDPQGFLGGRAQLDRDAAEFALETLGKALGVDMLSAAQGVHRIVNTQMAEGIRIATVRQGVDPRRFALLGFGGAAGLHVTALARLLDIERVIVPRLASVLSAWGMLATELRYAASRSHIGETDALDANSVAAIFDELERSSGDRLKRWFNGEIAHKRSADMRYGEQIFEIEVPLDDIDFAHPKALDDIKQAFEARHRELYTYALEDQDPLLINARVTAIGKLAALPDPDTVEDRDEAIAHTMRSVYLGDDWREVPVFVFDDLAADQELAGPAIVEADDTTVLLLDGDTASVTAQGWLDIAVGD